MNKYFWRAALLGICLVVMGFWAVQNTASARRNGPILIRDTEIENILQEWALPIFEAANMMPGATKLIVLQDDGLNAFVAGGANIFFYTGLLTKTEGPSEALGVLAHELGHVSGGHLIAGRANMKHASYEAIIGGLIGFGAAVLAGSGETGVAITKGAANYATAKYLKSSRANEASADQAALSYFEKAGLDPSGLATFMETLESQEYLPASRQNEYVRTHPLTSDRVDALWARIEKSNYKDQPYPEKWIEQHARMKAKLIGFIHPEQVSWLYSDRDESIPAEYARAVAAYRENHVEKALKRVDGLLQKEPGNPYFLELKGQMLVDFGRVEEALPYYRQSIDILGKAPLIRMALGHALLETGDNVAHQKEAIQQLENALLDERRSPRIHRLLATAYGRLGQEDMANIHLAEEAVLQGPHRIAYAKGLVQKSLKGLKNGSRGWLKAKDLLAHIETIEKQ